MADRYWVGGSGTWNTTSTTNWSASSGGASGASVPTVADSVFFDQAGTYTVTMTGALACLDITVSAGTVTFAAGTIPSLNVRGSMFLSAGTIWSSTGTTTFTATTTGKTITTNGTTINGGISFNGSGGGWTLGSALTISGAILDLALGSFNTGNYSLNAAQIASFNPTVRTLDFGSSIITLTSSSSAALGLSATSGLTFNAGTSQINLTDATGGISSGGLTFYNVAFTSTTSGTRPITGINTFNNLSVTAPASAGVTTVTFAANQTINGTLSTTGTAGNRRVFFASSTYGIGWNLTCNSAPSLTDADFRDIYVLGTAAPISGTRIGNRGNCTGITFDAPKTVYASGLGSATQNWGSGVWAASSGGAVSTDNYPLPQDTAVIDNASGTSLSGLQFGGTNAYVPTVDMSARTTAFNFSVASTVVVYGNWINGSGINFTNTTTLTFSGGNTQTITSAGKTIPCAITVNTYGGTVQLADALNISSNTLTVTNGTFKTQGYAVTASILSSSNSNVRAIYLGASTVTLTSTGNFLTFQTNTNLTFNAGTSTIVSSVGYTGTMSPQFGGFTYYNLILSNTTTAFLTYQINGQNTFNNLTITGTNASPNIQSLAFAANQTINGTLTCAGASAVRRIFLQSSNVGTQRTLTVNSLFADDCDFSDIAITGAASGASPTRAGDCGNNSGITFPAPKTVYWNLAGSQNWSATAWATSSGGSPGVNNFPLAQDTAIIDDTGAAGTITIDSAWNIGTFNAGARTTAVTIRNTVSTYGCNLYGDFTLAPGGTYNGIWQYDMRKVGTQTITSNGIAMFNNMYIQRPQTTVVLADAFSLTDRTLLHFYGTFNANGYNVTIGTYSASAASPTLYMGSGTWTVSGTGSCWSVSTSATLYAGTGSVVLSDTSTSARTFAGGGLYYNKLTIGGTTGTSTLTITGNNTFGELASTKTVAHTIAFGTTVQNFGKWSVTGTAGNVVTITGTDTTNNIYGPAVTGIDYLAMGTWGISTTSPGEFYAGANSTGTAAAPVYRTAAPAPRTLYWVGGTGNWSSTTKWSTSSGGASGAAIPTSLDSVVFDSASNATAYTATIDAGVTIARCAAFTMAGPASGNVTFAGTTRTAFHGNVSFAATGITRTYTGVMYLTGNSSYTFTTNGVSMGSIMYVLSPAATWELGSALTSSSYIDLVYGSFSTSASNYSMNITSIYSSYSSPRTLLLNASSITLSSSSVISWATSTGLTVAAGTSTITSTSAAPTFVGGGQTFYNVSFTNTNASAISITGGNTFNALTWATQTGLGVGTLTLSADQTITGTLTLGSTLASAYRKFVRSDTIGTTRTLTVNSLAAGAADIDFRDITIAGAAAPISGTRFGDCKGNSGITFDAAKTVYYGQTGSASWGASGSGSWAATSGGALDATMFPLAQDTAVFPAATYPASGSTTTINASYNIGTIDMSLRTSNTMTLSTGFAPTVYGNWINGTGITLSGVVIMTFAGRGSQTITSAGRTFTQGISIQSPNGSVTLQDAYVTSTTTTYGFSLAAGTLNANNYNVTMSAQPTYSVITSGTLTKTLAVGSGTWTFQSEWNATTSTGLTVTGTGTLRMNNASTNLFTGGSLSYSGITLDKAGAGTLTISGNNTFANITNTYSATGASTINFAATTQTVSAFTATGTSGKLLTITGTSAASPATLVYTGASPLSGVGYLNTNFIRAYPTTATWVVGTTSNNGGSLGFSFASGGTVYNVTISETSTASESMLAYALFLASLSETTTAADQSAVAASVFNPAVAEVAAASDVATTNFSVNSVVTEAAQGADTTASVQTFATAVTETVTGTDTLASAQTFTTAVTETVTGADAIASTQTFTTAVTEQAQAVDAAATNLSIYGEIMEQAQGYDAVFASAIFAAAVNELTTGTDAVDAPGSIYNATLTDTVNAQDLTNAGAVFGAAIQETLTIADLFFANYLWNLIDDSQTTSWGNITTDTPTTWGLVDDGNPTTWQNVPTLN